MRRPIVTHQLRTSFVLKNEHTIAIVEDDAPLRDAINNLLKSSGFETNLFESAEAFLIALPTSADILITDVQMPGITGLELQSMLLARGEALPVIVITALLDDDTTSRALDCGAIACLLKPFDEAVLLSAIGVALARLN
jgi:FixJ family two-component response regulator